METKNKWFTAGKLLFGNLLRFLFSLTFVTVYQLLFGAENILAGVAISVGITMIPPADFGIRPLTMAGITLSLYAGAGLAAQFAIASPWIALPVNFLFTLLLMALSCEPVMMKPFISFLLCFVFCQATPVPITRFPLRLAGLLAGGALVALCILVNWKIKGIGKQGRTLRQQVALCLKNRSFLMRMSLGLAAAMLCGMLLGLKKPLWISIVVMSLTQLDFQQTVERMKHRSIATIFGIGLFVVVFGLLVPRRYAMILILAMGYLSYFTPEYRHKQVVNAICAINASLVLLDTSSAIENRILCLFGGILIVLLLWMLHAGIRRLQGRPTGLSLCRRENERSGAV